MANGIKVVKPNTPMNNSLESNVVVDSRAAGAMKIAKKVIVEQNGTDMRVFPNGAGVSQAEFVYNHGLGYAPAFLMFQTTKYDDGSTNTKVLPDFGAFAAPGYINATSNKQNITVTNLQGYSGEFGQRIYLTLIVFEEDLDAEV